MMCVILDDEGNELGPNQEGNIVVKLPLPPGTLATLWRNEERFVSSYMATFPGYYETSDGGYIDEDGYVFVMGRIDDVINIAGHRLSTGAMEEVVATHPHVAECAVFGTDDQLKGQKPLGLVVLKAGVECDEEALKTELVQMVRNQIGPIACYERQRLFPAFPRPGPARSCAAPCVPLPAAKNIGCPRPSMIRPVLMKSRNI